MFNGLSTLFVYEVFSNVVHHSTGVGVFLEHSINSVEVVQEVELDSFPINNW